MTFLPIVTRELLEAARQRATFRTRLGVAGAGLIIGGWIVLIPSLRNPRELGMNLFVALTVAAYAYSLLVGVFRTADCLSEEKREGTLGLLFLTDLKGYDIVMGKLAATSLNAFYGLLALFPVLAIPLLVGGVTVGEFWRVVLVALNNMFFSLAVGMFCSSVSRDERKAMVLAFLVVLFFAAGIPILSAMLDGWKVTRNLELAGYIMVPSPSYACVLAFDASARLATKMKLFYSSVACVHGMGWLLLVAASFIVPRTWQDETATPEAMRRREKLEKFKHGSSDVRRSVRRRWLDLNPFYWLIARQRMKIAVVWLFLALGALIWALGLTFDPRDWRDAAAYVWTALVAHTVLKLWIGSEACRRFSTDRQSGALELLLSTPLSVPSIVRGQTMALERQFALPACAVLLVDFVFLLTNRQDKIWVMIWLAGMVMFVADLVTLSWIGMWRGLNSRRPNRAAATSILLVLVLPWAAWAAVMTLLLLSDAFSGIRRGTFDEKLPLFLWLGLGLTVNLFFGLPARRRLLDEFRTVATTRFETRRQGTA